MDIEKVKEVRERSGVSLGSCKKALEKSCGDVDKALVELQKQGLLKAASNKSEAREGLIYSYVHNDGKLCAVVEVNCQTDFAARSKEFKEFVELCALQVASMNPKYISHDEIPERYLTAQQEIFKAQIPEKVPQNKIEQILNGKMNKWFSDVCLLNQKSVVESKLTIKQLKANLAMKISENVVIRRILRWKIGE